MNRYISNLAVVILNWKSASSVLETIDALTSSYANIESIVIVDNASGDMSLSIIRDALIKHNKKVVDIDGDYEEEVNFARAHEVYFLVQNKGNYGYAGGNNVGIRVAMSICKPKYILIVNSDARPRVGAIEKLLSSAESNPSTGFFAGVLVYPQDDNVIQCIGGGAYNRWFGRSRLAGKGERLERLNDVGAPHRQNVNYLMGACLLFRTDILDKVGYMDERFFLYCEEMDWQWRAMKEGWKLTVCEDAVIEHGDSGSTKGAGRSHLFHYYHNRAAILFNRKWFGGIFVCASTPFVILAAIIQAKTIKDIAWALKGIFDGYLGRTGKLPG